MTPQDDFDEPPDTTQLPEVAREALKRAELRKKEKIEGKRLSPLSEVTCKHCQKTFTGRRNKAFCSASCRTLAWKEERQEKDDKALLEMADKIKRLEAEVKRLKNAR